MNEVVFSKDNGKYTARTRKGSRVIIKEYNLGWDWWIDEGRELPAMSTDQELKMMRDSILKGSYETAEDAISSFIFLTNNIYNLDLTWRIEQSGTTNNQR